LFLVLLHEGLMPVRVTVLVFGRDVCILLVSAILYAAAGRREFKPRCSPWRWCCCISSRKPPGLWLCAGSHCGPP
jgi:hypothetical protein